MSLKINFIGVGAAKSGTTWLARGLQEHPEVFIPDEKELHYFYSGEGLDAFENFIPNNFFKGRDWFYGKFTKAKKNQKSGEFSVFYLCDPNAPELIKNELGNVKIVIMLRDPIKRLLSYHLWRHPTNSVDTFSEFIREKKEVVNTSFYYKDVKRYFDVFGKKNVFVGIFEEAMSDKQSFFASVCDFLDIDDDFYPRILEKKINKTEIISKAGMKKIFLFISKLRQKLDKFKLFSIFFGFLFKLKLNKLAEKLFFTKKGVSKKININDFKYLNSLFKSDVKNLEGLLGKQLKWLQL